MTGKDIYLDLLKKKLVLVCQLSCVVCSTGQAGVFGSRASRVSDTLTERELNKTTRKLAAFRSVFLRLKPTLVLGD